MHNPGKSCKLIKFSPLASLPEAEAEFLEETFDVVAVNYTDDGLEEYVGYAPLDFDAEDFRRRHYRMRQEGRLVRLSAHWNGSQIGTIGFKHHAI